MSSNFFFLSSGYYSVILHFTNMYYVLCLTSLYADNNWYVGLYGGAVWKCGNTLLHQCIFTFCTDEVQFWFFFPQFWLVSLTAVFSTTCAASQVLLFQTFHVVEMCLAWKLIVCVFYFLCYLMCFICLHLFNVWCILKVISPGHLIHISCDKIEGYKVILVPEKYKKL